MKADEAIGAESSGRSRQEKLKAEGSKQGSELKLEAVEAQS